MPQAPHKPTSTPSAHVVPTRFPPSDSQGLRQCLGAQAGHGLSTVGQVSHPQARTEGGRAGPWVRMGPPGESIRYFANTSSPCSQGSRGPRARTHRGSRSDSRSAPACLPSQQVGGQLRAVQMPPVPTQVRTLLLHPRPRGTCTPGREGIKPRPLERSQYSQGKPASPLSTPSPLPWSTGPAGEEGAELAGWCWPSFPSLRPRLHSQQAKTCHLDKQAQHPPPPVLPAPGWPL